MQTISTKSKMVLNLGRQGENRAAGIIFNEPAEWARLFGPGRTELLNQRPGEYSVYPVVLEEHPDGALWVVGAADTAFYGYGKCELRYLVDDVVVKSRTYITNITESIAHEETEPPEPAKGWVGRVLDASAAAQTAADRAETAAIRQPCPDEKTGTWWLWDAEKGEYVDSGVSIGGASGGGAWEQLADLTIDADAQYVVFYEGSLDDYRELVIEMLPTKSENADNAITDNVTLYICSGTGANTSGAALADSVGSYWYNGTRRNRGHLILSPIIIGYWVDGNANGNAVFCGGGAWEGSHTGLKAFTHGYKHFGAGSVFRAWGLRK